MQIVLVGKPQLGTKIKTQSWELDPQQRFVQLFRGYGWGDEQIMSLFLSMSPLISNYLQTQFAEVISPDLLLKLDQEAAWRNFDEDQTFELYKVAYEQKSGRQFADDVQNFLNELADKVQAIDGEVKQLLAQLSQQSEMSDEQVAELVNQRLAQLV